MNSTNNWSTECTYPCADCGICTYSFCCTPCAFGSLRKKVTGANCFIEACVGALCFPYMCCIAGPSTRSALRNKYNLLEQPCGDCMMYTCCLPCSIAQETREVKKRKQQTATLSAPAQQVVMQHPQIIQQRQIVQLIPVPQQTQYYAHAQQSYYGQ